MYTYIYRWHVSVVQMSNRGLHFVRKQVKLRFHKKPKISDSNKIE